jgi:hypothetical protein
MHDVFHISTLVSVLTDMFANYTWQIEALILKGELKVKKILEFKHVNIKLYYLTR